MLRQQWRAVSYRIVALYDCPLGSFHGLATGFHDNTEATDGDPYDQEDGPDWETGGTTHSIGTVVVVALEVGGTGHTVTAIVTGEVSAGGVVIVGG